LPDPEEKRRYLSADDDPEAWSSVLKDATSILDDVGIPYAAIGSIATTAMGYDESCSDIDLLVSAEDADRAADALARQGYETQKAAEDWLHKAVKDQVLVDVIFKVGDRNEIEADQEMFDRASETDINGPSVKVISAEDFLVMQAISNKRDASDYWFKGLQAAACDDLDWAYLLRRARVSPVRVLSLLLYARAEGNDVPKRVLDELYRSV
jgi:predicted nucleotidyltransferase